MRVGLRVQDLLDPKIFREKLDLVLREKNLVLTRVYYRLPVDGAELAQRYLAMLPRLEPLIDDTVHLVHEALDAGQWVLFEGAQASVPRPRPRPYPFVTSSSPVSAACAPVRGSARGRSSVWSASSRRPPPSRQQPFPTELALDAEVGRVSRRWAGIGTNTGRQRRPGWLDLVMVKARGQLRNTCSELAITKLDVLSPSPS